MRWLISLGWLWLMVCTAACSSGVSGAPPKPPEAPRGLSVPPGAQVLRAGERFEATAEVLGIKVGRLRMDVMSPCEPDKDEKWGVIAKMKTAGLLAFFNKTQGTAKSAMDPETAIPVHSHTHVEDGEDWRDYTIWAGEGRKSQYRFKFERSSGALLKGRNPLPQGEPVYDTQTALFAIKSWDAEPKEKSYFYVILGRRLWRADVRFEGKSKLEVGNKKVPTLLFKGTAHRVDLEPGQKYTPKKFALWLSDDQERRPLRVSGDGSIGAVTFHLDGHNYDAPCRAADEPKAPKKRARRAKPAKKRDEKAKGRTEGRRAKARRTKSAKSARRNSTDEATRVKPARKRRNARKKRDAPASTGPRAQEPAPWQLTE